MKQYYLIFQKINTICLESNKEDFDIYLNDFLKFLDSSFDEEMNKINVSIIAVFETKKFPFFSLFDINKSEKILLLNLFLIKSFIKNSRILSLGKDNFSNSNEIINETIDLYKHFNIFYLKIVPLHEEIHFLKGIIFKIVKYLIVENLILKHQIFSNNKTFERWSLNYNFNYSSFHDIFKITNKPFKLVYINDNYYQIGPFFTLIKKVFIENIKSNHYFKLNDITYIEKMINNKIFLNINDLNCLLLFFSKKGYSLEQIEKILSENNKNVLLNNEIIVKLKKEVQKNLFIKLENFINENKSNDEIEKFTIIKKKCINLFFNYCENIFKKEYNLNCKDLDKYLILSVVYEFFKNEFKKLSIKVNKEKFFEKYSEFDTELEYFDNENDDNKKKNLFYRNVNPDELTFLTYLIIFSKNEINKIIKLSIKKIKKILETEQIYEPILKNGFDSIVEKYENKYIRDYYFYCKKIIINYDKEDEKINLLFFEINETNEKNKNLISESSKLVHILNLFLLKNYCQSSSIFKNKIDNNGNLEIYFMFYFDFRGRFYLYSDISPTTNKYCRLFFNYGEKYLSDISNNSKLLDNILSKYQNFIDEVKLIFNIKNKLIILNEIVFWVLISIGKIKIDKSKTNHIFDFLNIALSLIKDPSILKDDFDYLEYNYYIRILSSLTNEKILLRCLLKDATASFFQNLIRILGSKDEETKKMANLGSYEFAYDWYSKVIELWKTDEIKKGIYNNELSKYFTRKTVKMIVMTLGYSSTFPTCYNYFQESIISEFTIDINKNNELREIFKRFFTFSREMILKNGPFVHQVKEIHNFFNEILKKGESIKIISRDDDLSNLTYFKTTTKHFDFIICHKNVKHRIIKNYLEADLSKIDTKKTKIAITANLVHFADALLVRDINKEVYKKNKLFYISIHDSFMVDFTNVSQFIEISNIEINKEVFKEALWFTNKNFNSIFIFL